MSIVGNILYNIAARVAAVTAPTALGGVTRFEQLVREGAWSGETLRTLDAPTRRFVIELAGDRGPGLSLMRGLGEMAPVRQTFVVVVAYKQGAAGFALLKAIAEDVEALALELTVPASDRYGTADTGIWQRGTVSGYSVDWDPGKGGTALVRLPVTCDYLP